MNLEKRTSDESLAIPDAPVEIPQLYEDHVNLMFELQLLAFQTDMTRVSTFMMSRELNNRTYPQIGVPDQHHATSHHGNKPEKMAQHAKINTYHVSLFAGFLDRLAKTQDGNGSLLDHTMILYGSGMGEGNVHSHDPISNLLIGGALGRHQGGQHIQSAPSTPMGNLLLTMPHKAAIDAPRIADSTGTFSV